MKTFDRCWRTKWTLKVVLYFWFVVCLVYFFLKKYIDIESQNVLIGWWIVIVGDRRKFELEHFQACLSSKNIELEVSIPLPIPSFGT